MAQKPIVFPWKEFLQSWLQKILTNFVSVKVWGILISSLALFWGAITTLFFGDYKSKDFLELLRQPGLISGENFVAILGIIYGLREVFKTASIYLNNRSNGKSGDDS